MNPKSGYKQPEIRKAIADTVKRLGISGARFREYSKTGYRRILTRFLYAFVRCPDRQKSIPDGEPRVAFAWTGLRPDLDMIHSVSERDCGFDSLLRELFRKFAPESSPVYLITGAGWVYFGFLDETVAVLGNLTTDPEEFYLVTTDFKKLAVYCADGELLQIFRTGPSDGPEGC